MNVSEIEDHFRETSDAYIEIGGGASCLDGEFTLFELELIIDAMKQLEREEL